MSPAPLGPSPALLARQWRASPAGLLVRDAQHPLRRAAGEPPCETGADAMPLWHTRRAAAGRGVPTMGQRKSSDSERAAGANDGTARREADREPCRQRELVQTADREPCYSENWYKRVRACRTLPWRGVRHTGSRGTRWGCHDAEQPALPTPRRCEGTPRGKGETTAAWSLHVGAVGDGSTPHQTRSGGGPGAPGTRHRGP